ncbi:MAG: hypothetical protein ACI4O3_07390 [Oscillospiraceae bacterium]
MNWYICFLLCVLIGGAALKLALDRKRGGMRILYIMFGCLAAAYILYIPPFFEQYGFAAALFGCFINVMQVISLDADYLFFYDLIMGQLGAGVFANLYLALLAVLHFLLPVVSAMTAVTLILRCLAQLRLGLIKRHRRPLHVFSQINDRAVLLAGDIARREGKCDILFLGEPEGPALAELRQRLHCTVLNEKIGNIRAGAKRRKVYYYCISEGREENLNDALSVLNFLEDKEPAVQRNNRIFLFSSDRMAELMLDSIHKGSINISLIDETRIAVYNLLEQYPLPQYAPNGEINVLLCGFSNLGETFLRSAAWCGQLSGYSLRFRVIGRDIRNQADDFRARYPGLMTDRYSIEFFSYENELEFRQMLHAHGPGANYVVAACGNEEETVEKAVCLRRFFYRADGQFNNAPPIFAYIPNSEKAGAVAALTTAEAKPERRMPYDITPFGMADGLYTFRNITDSDLERLSRNVHLVYEDIFSDDGIDVAAALERYNLFEVNKSSNRANALHIRYKLAMLGLDYTDDPQADEVDFAEYLTDEALERLTVAEHDRWMAFLESEGWEGSTVEEALAYQKSGISKGRHNCPLLKLHPYICPFDELKERSDRLGLPDSTVYDRELIARIPDILHDKWKVSGKSYKIIKIQSGLGG